MRCRARGREEEDDGERRRWYAPCNSGDIKRETLLSLKRAPAEISAAPQTTIEIDRYRQLAAADGYLPSEKHSPAGNWAVSLLRKYQPDIVATAAAAADTLNRSVANAAR